jgi:hypothetical protein
MDARRKAGKSKLSKETKFVERRRKVVLQLLMSETSSPEKSKAKDDIFSSYPALHSLVTEAPLADLEHEDTAGIQPVSENSSLEIKNLFGNIRQASRHIQDKTVTATQVYNSAVWSTTGGAQKKSPSKQTQAFTPVWEDYDVMRNRWRYIKPYTTQLNEEQVKVPSNASDRWIQTAALPTPVFGNVADAEYFEKRINSPKLNGTAESKAR